MKRPLSMEIRTLDLRDGCEMPRNQWEKAARDLETELESANLRNIELTSRLDRALYEAREATGRLTAVDKSLFAAMAVVHFFDGLHAHALRGRIARQRAELRMLNVQMRRDAESIKELSHRLIDADMELSDIRELCASAGCEAPEECAAPAFAMVEELRQRGVCLRESPCTPPLPAATATFAPGWKTGDACEVRLYCANLADTEWLPARVLRHHPDGTYAVEVQGRTVRADVCDIRRPIPPSEPTIDAGIASAFGAFPNLPDTCEDDESDVCAMSSEPSEVLDDIRAALGCQPGHELQAIAALVAAKDERSEVAAERLRLCMRAKRERDEATARATRAEWALQRVRAALDAEQYYPIDALRGIRKILNEESGR